MKGRILVINTGSTSSKIGFYDSGEMLFEKNLTHSADTLHNIFGHTFVKFVKWEIIPENEYDFPNKITMYYIGKDNESGEEKEYSKKLEDFLCLSQAYTSIGRCFLPCGSLANIKPLVVASFLHPT